MQEKQYPPKGSTNTNPPDLSFWQLIKEDFKANESDLFSQGFWALFNHRFGNWRMGVKPKILRAPLTIIYHVHRKLVQILCGIKLDYTVQVGRRVQIDHFGGMIIGAKKIGDDVILRQNTTLGIKSLSNLEGKPTIENGVSIGAGAVIVGDITVGKNSTIGPNVVIFSDIPENSIVYPAKPSIIDKSERDKPIQPRT